MGPRRSDRVRQWWHGSLQDHSSREILILGTRYHWTAKVARAVVFYVRDHHQFVVGSLFAIASLAVGYLALK